MIKIAPSILAADFSRLAEQIRLVEQGGADLLHIDVMDGHFVPNITIGPVVVESIKKHCNLPFDVHLMIENPEKYIENFAQAGADIITVHVEATRHLQRCLRMIKDLGLKACAALNPATPLHTLDYVLNDVDMVLLMTVNPGFGGQQYIPAMTEKIASLKQKLDRLDKSIDIEIDGGIGADNIDEVTQAGANVIVAGSAIYKSDDVAGMITKLKKSV
ncbi:MAG: ribulose-phosphate 3-epimerase [Firmicutes bacterium]|nr:ribulose-phosphate 3-epimerase [Bacillota bacterium]